MARISPAAAAVTPSSPFCTASKLPVAAVEASTSVMTMTVGRGEQPADRDDRARRAAKALADHDRHVDDVAAGQELRERQHLVEIVWRSSIASARRAFAGPRAARRQSRCGDASESQEELNEGWAPRSPADRIRTAESTMRASGGRRICACSAGIYERLRRISCNSPLGLTLSRPVRSAVSQPLPFRHALGDALFVAALGRLVELLPLQRRRENSPGRRRRSRASWSYS